MIRSLTLNQIMDPARGTFMVKDRAVRENGKPKKFKGEVVFVTPAEAGRDGSVQTYNNSFEFIVARS